MKLQDDLLIARYATRRKCVFGILMLMLSSVNVALSQTVASSTSLQTLQLQAQSAVMGTPQPTSLALDGTFASTEGSLTQNGNVHLTVGSDGTFLITLSRTAGAISESRTVSNGVPSCTWTDQENVVHNTSFLNCMPPAWFFPCLALLSSSTNTSALTWMPSSSSSDSLGNHLLFQLMLPSSGSAQGDKLLLSPFDLVIAPNTYLPQYAFFTAHPDNPGVNADIPVEIAYSNYQSISGVMIPFHIQRFVNGSLVLDLAITTATVQ